MRVRSVSLGLALSAIALTTGNLSAAVKTGAKAPEFSLLGHDGKTHKLSDYKGKVVVLEWFNDECPYVKKHYNSNNMQALQKEFGSKDVVWFTVASSAAGLQGHIDAKQAGELIKKHEAAPRAILLDHEGTVGKLFDAKTTPHMYIITADGTLTYQGAIDDTPSANIATVKTAKPLFANALNAVLANKPVTEHTTKPYGCGVKYK